MAQQVNDIEFERVVVERVGPTVLAFLGYDSIACDHYRPELKLLAKKLDSRVPVMWLDADENPTLAEELQITEIPTTLLFKNGELLERYEGAYSWEKLLECIVERGLA